MLLLGCQYRSVMVLTMTVSTTKALLLECARVQSARVKREEGSVLLPLNSTLECCTGVVYNLELGKRSP